MYMYIWFWSTLQKGCHLGRGDVSWIGETGEAEVKLFFFVVELCSSQYQSAFLFLTKYGVWF